MGAGRGSGMTDGKLWYKPKLIEVALPLEDINHESAREKSIRHGHPSTMHLWWARRPLAACRAVLFAQLVDDPSAHPEQFPTEAEQEAERKRLHGIISELVKWENIHNEALLKEARDEIRRSCGGNPPPILDPFAGGGSIPLEAQRLGLEAHASDLNPVAVLINKALIEIPPKWAGHPPVFPGAAESAASWPNATGLAEDVRRYGQWMRDEAEKRIGRLYPKVKISGVEATVIAWIWARTVTCPNPACAGIMPLVRSFWLGKKKGKERYVVPLPDGKCVRFQVGGPKGIPRGGTVSRTGAVCLLCGSPVPLSYIRAEGKAGRLSAQLMAIVAEGPRQRYYLAPTDEHERAADVPRPDDVPEAELPEQALGFRVQGYGMRTWADLFTNRQLSALTTFSDLVREARGRAITDGAEPSYANAVITYCCFALNRVAMSENSLVRWNPVGEKAQHMFGRQAISMLWDFADTNPFGKATGSWEAAIDLEAEPLDSLGAMATVNGTVDQVDAAIQRYGGHVITTDPPYYDNVGYADLSDFFYVWLRRSLSGIYPELLGTVLTPKTDELIADPFRHQSKEKAEQFFEKGFTTVFARMCDETSASYPMTVFYAYKQAEANDDGDRASTGWDTLLEGMISSGWVLTATWPVRTEMPSRMRGMDSNALASSIVLACRPRPAIAGVTDRRGLIAALREELPEALRILEHGSIAPVDLRQAAIGPGMAVFSRYARVNEPDGTPMRVRAALSLINQVLDEKLSQLEGDVRADTRWCVEWFKSYGFNSGPFGTAETLSKGTDTGIEMLDRTGVLRSRGGKVTLLAVEDLPGDYDPAQDDRVSEWKVCLNLAKRLKEQGANATTQLMAAAAKVLDLDEVRELTYLLYSIADKKGWTDTAFLFNSLGTSWRDLDDASRRLGRVQVAYVQDQLS
jgi:putative DNA methylase